MDFFRNILTGLVVFALALLLVACKGPDKKINVANGTSDRPPIWETNPPTNSIPSPFDHNGICVDGAGGDDSNPGTATAPVATIARGIELAEMNKRKSVFIAEGIYTESVSTTVNLYGGFGASNWGFNRKVSATTIVGDGSRTYAVMVTEVANVEIDSLIIRGPATAEDSYSVLVYGGAKITNSRIAGGSATNLVAGVLAGAPGCSLLMINDIVDGGDSSASESSGVIVSDTGCRARLVNNTIYGGTGNQSRGIEIPDGSGSDLVLINNILDGGSGANSSYAAGIGAGNHAAATNNLFFAAGSGQNCLLMTARPAGECINDVNMINNPSEWGRVCETSYENVAGDPRYFLNYDCNYWRDVIDPEERRLFAQHEPLYPKGDFNDLNVRWDSPAVDAGADSPFYGGPTALKDISDGDRTAGFGFDIGAHELTDMVSIPAGCYKMGDLFNEGDSDELPVHTVCLSQFYMDRHEVTMLEYKQYIASEHCEGGSTSYHIPAGMEDYPYSAERWHEAKDFCAWIGKRLPTEAEWEYAARGVIPWYGRYPWGDTIDCSKANYGYCLGGGDQKVKVESYPPNSYGLYDMIGNVWEWVNDVYDSDYYKGRPNPDHNPTGPAEPDPATQEYWSHYRILRGGAYGPSYIENLRVSNRTKAHVNADGNEYHNVGFRCVADVQ